jgi:hypothetical protein
MVLMKSISIGHFITALLLASMDLGFSQGFVNLDFGGANVSGYSPGNVPASDAMPGWTASRTGRAGR